MSLKMKIVALTIDGVLNNSDSISSGIYFIPEKIKMLDKIAEKTGANIAIVGGNKYTTISDKYSFYNDLFKALGMKRSITWHFKNDEELAKLLKNKGVDKVSFVMLSSSTGYRKLGDNRFVYVNYAAGLQDTNVDNVVRLLGG